MTSATDCLEKRDIEADIKKSHKDKSVGGPLYLVNVKARLAIKTISNTQENPNLPKHL